MDAIRKVNSRLRNYPIILGKCSKTGTAYAECVTRDLNVKQNVCEKEFVEFKNCLQKAAKDMKTKL